MMYLFYGSDTDKVRRKAFEWVAAARKKEPNLTYVRLAREDMSASALLEAATSNSLFAKRTLTLLDDPYTPARGGSASGGNVEEESEENQVATTSVLDDYLDMLAESDNAIVILAPRLAAARAKKLAAKATKIYEFSEHARLPAGRQGFNSGLVNALGAKNREKLWLEIVCALRAGDAPEMLHGLLHWKARDLMEKGSRAWSPAEARALSLALISLLQTSRRKGFDLSESLERFALSV